MREFYSQRTVLSRLRYILQLHHSFGSNIIVTSLWILCDGTLESAVGGSQLNTYSFLSQIQSVCVWRELRDAGGDRGRRPASPQRRGTGTITRHAQRPCCDITRDNVTHTTVRHKLPSCTSLPGLWSLTVRPRTHRLKPSQKRLPTTNFGREKVFYYFSRIWLFIYNFKRF